MSQLMLINPRKRTGGRKKPRSAAQKAATKRMLAARRGSNPVRRTKRHKRRSNPVAANPIGLHRVKRRTKRHHVSARRRHNPLHMPSGAGGIGGMLMTSVHGAGGALLVNTALNYIPMPALLKSGNGKYLARVGVAIALGVFGGKVLPKKIASNMAVGAMTVAFHDLLLGLASQAMPTARLGDIGDYDDGVAAYVSGQGMAGLADMSGMYDTYDTAGNVGEYIYK